MKRFITVLLGFSLLFITGCSQMDVAASVGKTDIELATLQSRVDSILAERRKVDTSQMQLQDGDVLTRSQLSFLISNLILDEIAGETGIEVTKADLEGYKAEIFQSIGGEEMLSSVLVNAAIAPEALDDVLRRDLILRKIGSALADSGATDGEINDLIQNLVREKSKQLKIVINPRYGVWDPTSISVLGTDPAGDAVTNK
ncbi:MAG: SurA N-terminal domain-containing protein [Actinomycetales bacterium]